MSKKYYITTTLPYVNAKPHIGFALEIVQADVLARYHRLVKDKVIFNFGTDEHGQKIYQKAKEENKKPKQYVDEYAIKFNALKNALNLSYDRFIRTTDKKHIKAAQHFWQLCAQNGDIYKKNYKAKYCVGCELEKTNSELEDGRCPLHPSQDLEIIEEENYFFRFSRYQKPLLELYKNQPDFVKPKSKYKEIINFVKKGLQDFSISRLKEKMPWGIEVPGDPDHVMYVWFDALINYISTLGWPDGNEYKQFWPGYQIAGKDNLRQQTAIWQAMLLSAGLPNSKQIFIHGFISVDGQKMSKSLGNVVDPIELVDNYGTDAVRYFLLSKIHPWKDSDFTIERFENAYNDDLANGLGNLVARTAKLAKKNNLVLSNEVDKNPDLIKQTGKLLEKYRFDKALNLLWDKISDLDKYLNIEEPWKKDQETANKILQNVILGNKEITGILEIANALKIFMPETARKIKNIFSDKKTDSNNMLFPRL